MDLHYSVVRESLHGSCFANLRNTGDNSGRDKVVFVGRTYLGEVEIEVHDKFSNDQKLHVMFKERKQKG